jgi:hypothetical protein
LHGQGLILAQVFWGLWLLPFGMLVIRSGFIPRVLGAWLILNGFAYMILSSTALLLPQYSNVVRLFTFPVLFGELAVMLWLIIMGVKTGALEASAA